MRTTSQKLLLLAYFSPSALNHGWVNLDNIGWLIPELSAAGLRSLVYLLQRKRLIDLATLDGKTHFSLTHDGARALTAKFRSLDPRWREWQGNWQEIVFLTPPKGDGQFRYLRSVLVKEQALALTRGVYLLPQVVYQAKVKHLIDSVYQQSVVVLDLDKQSALPLKPIVMERYSLVELYNHYSSISNQINSLLDNSDIKKGLIKKKREFLVSVLNQLRLNLENDPGLIPFYFPQFPQVDQLLSRLREAYLLLSY